MKTLPGIFAAIMLCLLFGLPLAQSISGGDSIAVFLELEDERDVEDVEDIDIKDLEQKYFYSDSYSPKANESRVCNIHSSCMSNTRIRLNLFGVDTPPPELA